MSFFGSIGKAFGAVAQLTLPVVIAVVYPEAMINTAGGLVIKHGTPIPNNAIPVLNAVVSIGVSFIRHGLATGWHTALAPAIRDGILWMTTSTALHQSIKIPLGENVTGPMAKAVGPGVKFSF